MAHHVLVQQYVVCVCVLCYAVAVLRDNRLTATDVTAQIRASTPPHVVTPQLVLRVCVVQS